MGVLALVAAAAVRCEIAGVEVQASLAECQARIATAEAAPPPLRCKGYQIAQTGRCVALTGSRLEAKVQCDLFRIEVASATNMRHAKLPPETTLRNMIEARQPALPDEGPVAHIIPIEELPALVRLVYSAPAALPTWVVTKRLYDRCLTQAGIASPG